MNFSDPRQVANYREKTMADRVPGIGFFKFKCKCCKGSKEIAGRKKHPSGQGWKCKDCVTNNSGETK